MRRSLLTLVSVLFAAPAWAGKPKIAILGLEPFDASTKTVTKELTERLRDRAKTGTGSYALAPGTSVELVAEKKAGKCASEAVTCMAAIGANLNADVLMWGNLRATKDGHAVTLKLIDVSKKRILGAIVDRSITAADAGDPIKLAALGKSLYQRLTAKP